MAVKRRRKKRRNWNPLHPHGPGLHQHLDAEDLAARLAPLEETEAFTQSEQSNGNHSIVKDTIRVDKNSVKMPEQMLDDERRDAASTFRLDTPVIVILLLMLAFTAFIAWQITQMPYK